MSERTIWRWRPLWRTASRVNGPPAGQGVGRRRPGRDIVSRFASHALAIKPGERLQQGPQSVALGQSRDSAGAPRPRHHAVGSL